MAKTAHKNGPFYPLFHCAISLFKIITIAWIYRWTEYDFLLWGWNTQIKYTTRHTIHFNAFFLLAHCHFSRCESRTNENKPPATKHCMSEIRTENIIWRRGKKTVIESNGIVVECNIAQKHYDGGMMCRRL